MKTITSALLLLSLALGSLPAQVPTAPPPLPPAEPGTTSPTIPVLFTAEQLDQMLAPIALYPDALIALILPASTNTSDVVLAARFLQAGGQPGQADLQPWDDSVRALAHYPQLVRWMDENLAWTKQLGDAFTAQPADVMNAVQRLRARARAAGTLSSTPQQQVVVQENSIVIVPTDPDIIYVPYYDPVVVYEPSYYRPSSYFTFSAGFATGWWMCYGLDWPRRHVWAVNHNDRERYWREHQRDWNRHVAPPPPERHREIHVWQPHRDFHPRPFNGRPVVSPAPRFDDHRGFPRDGRRESPPHSDQRRDGGYRPSHSSGTPETALATPRPVGPAIPASSADIRPIPADNVAPAISPAPSQHRRDRSFEPRGRNDYHPVPGTEAPRGAIRGPDTRPAFTPRPAPAPDIRAPVTDTRPRIPDTRPPPSYHTARPFVPPASSAALPPPRAPEPRIAPPMRTAPPQYTPPPPPPQQQQQQSSGDQSQTTGRGDNGRRPFIRR